MPDIADIEAFITTAIAGIISVDGGSLPDEPLSTNTPLIGSAGVLSSLALVELLVELEGFCEDQGREFDWTSNSAFSGQHSIYRTIGTLAAHIAALFEGAV